MKHSTSPTFYKGHLDETAETGGRVCSLCKQLWTEPAVNGSSTWTHHTQPRCKRAWDETGERRVPAKQSNGRWRVDREAWPAGRSNGGPSGQRGPDKAGQVHWGCATGRGFRTQIKRWSSFGYWWCKALWHQPHVVAPLANHDSYRTVRLNNIMDGWAEEEGHYKPEAWVKRPTLNCWPNSTYVHYTTMNRHCNNGSSLQKTVNLWGPN
jgi:hypothetical protein